MSRQGLEADPDIDPRRTALSDGYPFARTEGGRSASASIIRENAAMATTPRLAGVHHLKLPVSDLERSRRWYESRLGYRVAIEFVEDGVLMGVALAHPNGGPPIAIRLDPQRAAVAAGFDYFAIGVPDKPTLDELAARLTELGDPHGGVHEASAGWILPFLHDPDGHEVRFYTVDQGAISEQGGVLTVQNGK